MSAPIEVERKEVEDVVEKMLNVVTLKNFVTL